MFTGMFMPVHNGMVVMHFSVGMVFGVADPRITKQFFCIFRARVVKNVTGRSMLYNFSVPHYQNTVGESPHQV